MTKHLLLPLLLAASLFANDVPPSVIQTGHNVSALLMKQLGSKLKHELHTNGVLSALKFCNENAYVLTEEINLRQVEGVSIKRISLKERNPANTPSQDEKEVLQSMQVLLDKKELPSYIIRKEGNTYKYYKPLVIKKQVCLKCHGNLSNNEELSSFLQENYPLDKAIGYKMNELRGAIVVKIRP